MLERRSPQRLTSSAAPPATGYSASSRASSATPLSYGIFQTTGACAPVTRRAVVRLLRLNGVPFSKGVLLVHLPVMRWRLV